MSQTTRNLEAIGNVEVLYDKYASILFGIASSMANSKNDAEQILIDTFVEVQKQSGNDSNRPLGLVSLIKLTILTAHKFYSFGKLGTHFKPKLFENTPLLNQLLSQQQNLEKYCVENKITMGQAAKKIREELWLVCR